AKASKMLHGCSRKNAHRATTGERGETMSQEEIARFADRELEQIAAQREQAINAPFADLHREPHPHTRPFRAKRSDTQRGSVVTAKGGLPYLGALPVGESKLILQAKIPTDNPGQDGKPRKAFVVKKSKDGEEFAWTVNIRSPLYRDLLGFLKTAPITIRVIRTGEGQKDTRYTVKAA